MEIVCPATTAWTRGRYMQALWSSMAGEGGGSYGPVAPGGIRTTTFDRPPAGPTTTSSSFVGVLAQNGSASRLVMAMAGGAPLSFTVPSMTACPGGGAAADAGPVAVVAPGATAGGAEAAGDSFWQAPAMVDAASARMARPGLIMVVVLTGARRPVKRRVRLGWLDR